MPPGSSLILAVVASIVMCTAVSAASKRHGAAWNYFHFDGQFFVAGQPDYSSPILAVRDGVVPVVLTRMVKIEAISLPSGTGALAGICYIQISGGRLADGNGYVPCPGLELTVSSDSTIVRHTETDDSGFFVALLPPGRYRVSNGAFAAEVSVERGTTALIPLRAGKRMVD